MKHSWAISTKQLAKLFNGKEVVHNCNLKVEKGSIYGFLGKNGAGKTTVFKMLLGLLSPSCGEVAILGMDSGKNRLEILRRTGSLIETPIFYEHLSAKDNLSIHLDYMGITEANIEATLTIVGLPNVGTEPVATFSTGMRQRLAIARAIVHNPELLILDEPINGLDPAGIKEMRELFYRLAKQQNITILLSSHILSEIEQIADYIGFMVNGQLVKEIKTSEFKEKHTMDLESYFIKITNGDFIHE